MADGLSLREFGRQQGVTGEAVRKAIASGKIPADCIEHNERGWPVIVDPTRAAKEWGRNRDPNQVRDKATMAAGAKRGWAQRRGEDPPPEDGDDEHAAPPGGGAPLRAGGSLPSITESKAITEAYKARMAKLEFEEKSGKLVNADQVKVGYISQVTAARNRLLGVPSEAKQRIPHLTIEEIETIEDLVGRALQDVADGVDAEAAAA